MNVKLTKSGNAVRTNNLSEVRTNSNGVISSFSFGDDKYKLFTEGNRLRYLENGVFEEYDFRAGYYKIELYNEYMADSSKTSYLDLKKNGQFKNFAPVKVGDYVEVNIIRYEPPYNDFLLFKKYEVQVTDVNEIYTLNGLLNEDKFSGIILRNPVDPGLYATTFYANHISYLGQDYDEDAAIEFVKLLVRTSLRLQYVHDEILPILLNLSGNCEDQSVIETAVDEIKASWLSPDILGGTSMKSLAAFYKMIGQLQRAVFRNQNILGINLCEDRLFWLFHLMPVNVLKNFTYDRKLKVLHSVFENEKKYGEKLLEYNAPPDDTILEIIRDQATPDPTMAELHQRFVAKMFFTFKENEADQLLDFLLIKKDGEKSYFEIFYHSLSDAVNEDINFVEWFVNEKSNRAFYCKALYELWLTSKYNPYYGSDPLDLNSDGLNMNSYWLDQNQGLSDFQNQPQIIQYSKLSAGATASAITFEGAVISVITKFETDTELETSTYVNIYSSIFGKRFSWGVNGAGAQEVNTPAVKEYYGKYHLYHPITLMGYDKNSELEFPTDPNIPAFLYFHAEEFDRIKDYAALINLAIDIGTEVIAFFGTGGLGMLRHFRHLKVMTKWWKINQLNPTDVVMYWKTFASSGEAISIYASTVSSFLTYKADIENDEDLADRLRKISMFFLLLSIGSSITPNNLSKVNKVSASHEELKNVADEIIDEIDLLDADNVPHGYPQEIEDLARTVRAGYDVSISEYEDLLIGLTGLLNETSNNILTAYQNLSGIKKYKFFSDFKNYSDDAVSLSFWNKLNESGTDRLDQWEYLVSLKSNRLVRTNIDILDDVKIIRNVDILDSSGVSILDEVIEGVITASSNPKAFKFVKKLISRTDFLNEELITMVDQIQKLNNSISLERLENIRLFDRVNFLLSKNDYLNPEELDKTISLGVSTWLNNNNSNARSAGFLSEIIYSSNQLSKGRRVKMGHDPSSFININGVEIPLNPPTAQVDVVAYYDELTEGGMSTTRSILYEVKESGSKNIKYPFKGFKNRLKDIGEKFNNDGALPIVYRDNFDELHGVINIVDGNLLTSDIKDIKGRIKAFMRSLRQYGNNPKPISIEGLERMNSLIILRNGEYLGKIDQIVFTTIN